MDEVYRELSKKLMLEHSRILPKIWALLCSEEEAVLVNLLPGTPEEIAARTGKPLAEVQGMLKALFHKGAVFEGVREGKTVYRMPRHIVQFHDASILWPEAPQALMDLWVEFMDTDYPALLEMVTQLKLPSFMRVLPIDEAVGAKDQILAFEDAQKILQDAKTIAVTTCVCRKSIKKCDAPLEVCLQINRGAEYAIKRGTGKQITLQEGLGILKQSEDAGLVHLTENIAGSVNAICNCCTCCCEMLRYISKEKTKGVLAPSRYLAMVDVDACTACGACADICPTGAIAQDGDQPAHVDAERCIGCGLCASACPVCAISLKEVRPADFIPKKG
jgi:ferredoxin